MHLRRIARLYFIKKEIFVGNRVKLTVSAQSLFFFFNLQVHNIYQLPFQIGQDAILHKCTLQLIFSCKVKLIEIFLPRISAHSAHKKWWLGFIITIIGLIITTITIMTIISIVTTTFIIIIMIAFTRITMKTSGMMELLQWLRGGIGVEKQLSRNLRQSTIIFIFVSVFVIVIIAIIIIIFVSFFVIIFIFGSVVVINSIAFLISVFVFIIFMSVFVNCCWRDCINLDNNNPSHKRP